MNSVKEIISFIFLCDGPCTPSSWRSEDQSMYWARRDALARITAMCLWQGPGSQSSVCDECSLLFHEIINTNGSEVREEILAGLAMTGTQLVPTLPVPTEKTLVGLWKAAALYSSKFPQKAGIGSRQTEQIKNDKLGLGVPSGVQMSFTPWKEAAFLSNPSKSIGSAIASKLSTLSPHSDACKNSDKNSMNRNAIVATAEHSKTISVKKKSAENNVDLEAFDKRFILRTMQKQCSVEFLRKNNLAGSEELILKKKNKASILLAYTEWVTGKGTEDSEVIGVECDGDGDGDGDGMSHVRIDQNKSNGSSNSNSNTNSSDTNSSNNNSDISNQRLIDTFSVLYSRSNCIRTTVLLLHEDYSSELPVFGQKQKDKGQLKNPSGYICTSSAANLSSNKGNLGSGIPGISGTENKGHIGSGLPGVAGCEKHRIICIMGAVRDASDSEVSSAIAAAERMGIRCVGANLGRTAEFTSKIVAALLGHARAGVLGAAVDDLPSIATQSINHNVPDTKSHSSNDIKIPHNLSIRGVRDELKIEKLAPNRQGGWTWDGQSNKISKRITPHTGVKNTKTSDDAGTIIDDNHLISSEKASGSVWTARDVIQFHAVLWLPYNATDITIEIDDRERFHTLIQTAVCTLWRSRVASESQFNSIGDTCTIGKSVAHKSVTHKSVTHKSVTHKSVALSDVISGTDNGHHGNDKNGLEKECDIMTKIKKRKADNITGVGRKVQPSCPIQPTLSLVFSDGSTASITQEQLTLTMARRRMAAPTEYQVLVSLIEILGDQILDLIKNQSDTCTEQISTISFPPQPGGSSSLSQSSGSWIKSLSSLLPSGLNRKERKKVVIIDIVDLISTGFRPDIVGGTYGSHCKTDTTRSDNSTHTPPCLSSIAYSANCGCSTVTQDDTSQLDNDTDNDTSEHENTVLVLLRSAAYYTPVTEKNSVLKGLNKSIGLMTSLSSSDTVHVNSGSKHVNSGNKHVNSGSQHVNSGSKHVSTAPGCGDRTLTEGDRTSLNYMLNTWIYGSKSGKHDLTVPSKLYCMASISNTPHLQSTNAMQDMSDHAPQEMLSEYIAPAAAVCVLQHWAYHRRLLPALKIAKETYLT